MQLWRISDSSFNLRVFNKKFVGLENHGGGNKIEAVSDSPNNPETFEIIRDDNDPFKIRIKASNGHFLQVLAFMLLILENLTLNCTLNLKHISKRLK